MVCNHSFFREISFVIATQTVIWLVVETLLLSQFEQDFSKFCGIVRTQLKRYKLVVEHKIIEDMNKLRELTYPPDGVLIVAVLPKGKDNYHYHIKVYFNGLLVYERLKLSPGKYHDQMAIEAARKVLQEWKNRNPKANKQKPNTRKRR